MTYSIALVPGDGDGPEFLEQAAEALDAVADKFDHTFNYIELLAGGCSIDDCGEALTAETLEAAKECDAVLLGPLGGPDWAEFPEAERPERALDLLRDGLGLGAQPLPDAQGAASKAAGWLSAGPADAKGARMGLYLSADPSRPLGTLLSAALLLRHSLGLEKEARALESAIEAALAAGPSPRAAESPAGADDGAVGESAGIENMGRRVADALAEQGR